MSEDRDLQFGLLRPEDVENARVIRCGKAVYRGIWEAIQPYDRFVSKHTDRVNLILVTGLRLEMDVTMPPDEMRLLPGEEWDWQTAPASSGDHTPLTQEERLRLTDMWFDKIKADPSKFNNED